MSDRTKVWLPGNQMVIAGAGCWVITDATGAAVDVTEKLDKEYEVVEEGLFLPATHRAEVERVLGTGAMRTAEDLVRGIDSLARLEVGGILVDFTPGQWAELKHKAAVQNQTLEEYMTRLVRRFTQDLWSL